jgi:hypothetical protein
MVMAETKNYKAGLVGVFGHPVSENPTDLPPKSGPK